MTEGLVRRSQLPLRVSALVAASALTAVVAPAAIVAASTAPEPPPTAVTYANGVAITPDGSFSAAFAAAPVYAPSADGVPERLHADADEDGQDIARFGLDAFGAAADAGPTARAELFVAASGSSVEWLANTATWLGAAPAAHFIARLTLGDGRPAVVYGLVVVGTGEVIYAFATDIGGDDADRARQFVSSFTSLLPPPVPVAPTTTSTTTSTTTVPPSTLPAATAAPGAEQTPTTSGPTTSGVTTTVTSDPVATDASGPGSPLAAPPPPPPPSPAPVGSVVAPDGAWWVTFPEDAEVVATAATENGFAYSEYRAEIDGDVLAVRALVIPAGFRWDGATVPGFPAVTADGEQIDVDGSPAVASTFDAGGATVTAVVVDTGSRLVAVTYADRGGDHDAVAADFVESLGLAG